MKFTSSLAIIGLASAADELKFMNDQIADDYAELINIGNGVCANWSIEQKRVYDLKGFDADGRDVTNHAPADISFSGSNFVYKACGLLFPFNEKAWVASGGEKANFKEADFKDVDKSTAFWLTGTSVDYTFMTAAIKTLPTTGEAAKKGEADTLIDHWTLTWQSEEKCKTDKTKNFEVTLSATCDRSVDAGDFTNQKVDGCSATVDYKSKHACGKPLPIGALTQLAPFLGAFLIVFGLIMTFFGTKFLFYIFGAIIGLIVAGIVFGFVYAIVLPVDAEIGLTAGVIAVSVIIGGLVAYFTQSLTRKFTVPILGAAAGIFAFLMLSKVVGLKGIYDIVMAVAGAIIGWWLAFKFNTIIRALGTATVGAFLVVRGAGCYLPGFPSGTDISIAQLQDDKNATMELIGYLATFVILTIAGTIVQLRTQRFDSEEEEGDDAFKSQEEDRKCGCF